MKAVIDSDVLIDYLQGLPAARDELARYRNALYSVISWMEVMCGAKTEKETEAAKALFDSMSRVELTPEVAARAVFERKRLSLKLPDAIILTSADCEGCISRDAQLKGFSRNRPEDTVPLLLLTILLNSALTSPLPLETQSDE